MRKFLAILLVLCTVAFGQKSKLIISVSGELGVDVADVLMDGISYGLKNNDKYQILINDRQFKETLKKEWQKGNISDDRIIALAQNAGADYLCFTKIKSVKGLKGKQVTASVYDLETMSYTDQMGMETIEGDFSNLKHLTEIILDVVDDMLGTNSRANSEEPEEEYDWSEQVRKTNTKETNEQFERIRSNALRNEPSRKSEKSEDIILGGFGYQYLDKIPFGMRFDFGPLYFTMNMRFGEENMDYDFYLSNPDKKAALEWIVGLTLRPFYWVGIFGGGGFRHTEEHRMHNYDTYTEWANDFTYELGLEFAFEIDPSTYFAIFISKRNFSYIGGGISILGGKQW